MTDEYDFSQSLPNPYLKHLKPQVTLHVDEEVVSYFQALSHETGIPYPHLINLYLKDCVRTRRKPVLEWIN